MLEKIFLNRNQAATAEMSNILTMPYVSRTNEINGIAPIFCDAQSQLNYAYFDTLYDGYVLRHVYEKCRQRHHIFYFFTFFSKTKLIVFSAQIEVTVQFYFSSGRDFFLVFKYVYVYICFL